MFGSIVAYARPPRRSGRSCRWGSGVQRIVRDLGVGVRTVLRVTSPPLGERKSPCPLLSFVR